MRSENEDVSAAGTKTHIWWTQALTAHTLKSSQGDKDAQADIRSQNLHFPFQH